MAAILSAFRFGVRTGHYATEDMALLLRLNVWHHSMEVFFRNPLTGIGAGNLRFTGYIPFRLGPPRPGAGYVDNQYIQMFVEAGIIAGIAWIVYIVRSVKIGIKSLLSAENTTLQPAAFGAYSGLLVFVIGGFFWVITPAHELFATMIVYIAMLISIQRIASQASPKE
jgi:O-antigen ligase